MDIALKAAAMVLCAHCLISVPEAHAPRAGVVQWKIDLFFGLIVSFTDTQAPYVGAECNISISPIHRLYDASTSFFI